MLKKVLGLALALTLLFSLAACNDFELSAYKATAIATIQTYADGKAQSDYTDENWSLICTLSIEGKDAVNAAKDKADVDTAVAKATEEIDAVEKWQLDINNVVDIRIDIDAVKTQYNLTEYLDFSGLVVNAKMNNETFIVLRTRDFEIDESAYDKDTAGVYRISISFEEFKANFFVINSLTLEEKEPWQGDIYEIKDRFVWEVGRNILAPTYCDDAFYFTLDENFKNEILTLHDFKMFDNLESVEQGHNLIVIKIKNTGRDNVLETMKEMEKLDFVKGTEAAPIYYHR